MATKIKIYRGDQIGGCVTVISTDTTRIMIDYGEQLPGSKSRRLDYPWDKQPVDAVFFTHYHGDHIGRFSDIPPEKVEKLYMGETTRNVLNVINTTLKNKNKLRLLNDSERVCTFEEQEDNSYASVQCGDITVTPFRVDHSAYEAFMFLIETENERILHTGDFRGYGYFDEDGEETLKTIREKIVPVDTLIIEGTMMSRPNESTPRTEKWLREEAAKWFAAHKYNYLIVSSTNPDSILSFTCAAKDNGLPVYANYYVCRQMEVFQNAAEGEKNQYQELSEISEINQKRIREKKSELEDSGFVFLIRADDKSYAPWIKPFLNGTSKPSIIYSMWRGYLEKKHPAHDDKAISFLKDYEKRGFDVNRDLHTGGHATPEFIGKVIKAAKPQRRVLPMHTENAAGFMDLDLEDAYRERIECGAWLVENLREASGLDDVTLPQGIRFYCKTSQGAPSQVTMVLSKTAIGLFDENEAATNMQDAPAAFEAWALFLHVHLNVSVVLSVEDGAIPSCAAYKELLKPRGDYRYNGAVHYHRFLYRALKFNAQFGAGGQNWFSMQDPLAGKVNAFDAKMKSGVWTFWNNRPTSNSAPRTNSSSKKEKENEIKFANGESTLHTVHPGPVYQQLPVGLFRFSRKGSAEQDQKQPAENALLKKENAFFSGAGSAVDLWQIAGNELILYELKADNPMPGIITELMFYANYWQDMLLDCHNHWHPIKMRPSMTDHRNYRALSDAYYGPESGRITKIRACMLTDQLHPLISQKVIDCMNKNSDGIQYERLHYDPESLRVKKMDKENDR